MSIDYQNNPPVFPAEMMEIDERGSVEDSFEMDLHPKLIRSANFLFEGRKVFYKQHLYLDIFIKKHDSFHCYELFTINPITNVHSNHLFIDYRKLKNHLISTHSLVEEQKKSIEAEKHKDGKDNKLPHADSATHGKVFKHGGSSSHLSNQTSGHMHHSASVPAVHGKPAASKEPKELEVSQVHLDRYVVNYAFQRIEMSVNTETELEITLKEHFNDHMDEATHRLDVLVDKPALLEIATVKREQAISFEDMKKSIDQVHQENQSLEHDLASIDKYLDAIHASNSTSVLPPLTMSSHDHHRPHEDAHTPATTSKLADAANLVSVVREEVKKSEEAHPTNVPPAPAPTPVAAAGAGEHHATVPHSPHIPANVKLEPLKNAEKSVRRGSGAQQHQQPLHEEKAPKLEEVHRSQSSQLVPIDSHSSVKKDPAAATHHKEDAAAIVDGEHKKKSAEHHSSSSPDHHKIKKSGTAEAHGPVTLQPIESKKKLAEEASVPIAAAEEHHEGGEKKKKVVKEHKTKEHSEEQHHEEAAAEHSHDEGEETHKEVKHKKKVATEKKASEHTSDDEKAAPSHRIKAKAHSSAAVAAPAAPAPAEPVAEAAETAVDEEANETAEKE